MPFLTDTHCHIDLQQYDSDRQAMLARAWQNGIQRLLVPALDIQSAHHSLALAESDERIFIAAGVHPNYADSWNATTMQALRQVVTHPRVRAIGEIGLDYYRNHASPEIQKKILLEQLSLAAEVKKPVILHCRNAFDELFVILKEWIGKLSQAPDIAQHPGVLHSFGGDVQQARAAVEEGFFIGINGSITFKNAATIRDVARSVGIEYLLLETDAPYLTPVPFRGKRNEPAYTLYINDALAQMVNLVPDQCAKMTYNNACKVFNW